MDWFSSLAFPLRKHSCLHWGCWRAKIYQAGSPSAFIRVQRAFAKLLRGRRESREVETVRRNLWHRVARVTESERYFTAQLQHSFPVLALWLMHKLTAIIITIDRLRKNRKNRRFTRRGSSVVCSYCSPTIRGFMAYGNDMLKWHNYIFAVHTSIFSMNMHAVCGHMKKDFSTL